MERKWKIHPYLSYHTCLTKGAMSFEKKENRSAHPAYAVPDAALPLLFPW